MKTTEFMRGRNVEGQSITRYMQRHEEEFKGHIVKVGKEYELDEVAVELLDKKYPMPAPVEVIEDTESRRKLSMAYEKIIQLQEQINVNQEKIAKAESVQLLLESKEDELERERADKTERLKEKDELIAREQERANQERERADELLKQLEEERKKTWWDKLRGK